MGHRGLSKIFVVKLERNLKCVNWFVYEKPRDCFLNSRWNFMEKLGLLLFPGDFGIKVPAKHEILVIFDSGTWLGWGTALSFDHWKWIPTYWLLSNISNYFFRNGFLLENSTDRGPQSRNTFGWLSKMHLHMPIW